MFVVVAIKCSIQAQVSFMTQQFGDSEGQSFGFIDQC